MKVLVNTKSKGRGKFELSKPSRWLLACVNQPFKLNELLQEDIDRLRFALETFVKGHLPDQRGGLSNKPRMFQSLNELVTVMIDKLDVKMKRDAKTGKWVPREAKWSVTFKGNDVVIDYKKSSNLREIFWWSAGELCGDIWKYPKRLKICRFTKPPEHPREFFFWDNTTYAASQVICQSDPCKRKWAVERVQQTPSYKQRSIKPSKKRRSTK